MRIDGHFHPADIAWLAVVIFEAIIPKFAEFTNVRQQLFLNLTPILNHAFSYLGTSCAHVSNVVPAGAVFAQNMVVGNQG